MPGYHPIVRCRTVDRVHEHATCLRQPNAPEQSGVPVTGHDGLCHSCG